MLFLKGQCAHHVDEHLQRTLPLLDKLCCIVFLPLLLLILAKVPLESFLAPWTIDRVGDGREGGHGFVHARVLEELHSP